MQVLVKTIVGAHRMRDPANNNRACDALLQRLFCIAVLMGLFLAMPVSADEIRPALLDIKEQNTGLFAVTWKVPTRGDRVLAITPQLPGSLELVGSPTVQDVPGARIEHATYKNTGESLTGQTIIIDGLLAVQTDVLLLIQLQDGTQHSAILRPASPEFTIPLEASKLQVAGDYWRMGTIHILEGVDHLLFVLALLLIVAGFGQLLKAVTAFTVAHSITLALATLGVVHVPAAPTEAIIALSILFLATEIVHKHNGQFSLTDRYPWVIAFIFGLFHGLGFAGALSEIGVPQHEVPLALFMFNVGVETGQLLFIAVALSLIALLKRLPITAPQGAWRLLPYSIGSVAAFWTIERVVSFLPVAV
ncbi:MAG: HupE/UreJ family protein [Gammaproteobacteria bacterium]|nr:MAG: HupE/UreJ family protein [Gammaproteobacteria bacterium]